MKREKTMHRAGRRLSALLLGALLAAALALPAHAAGMDITIDGSSYAGDAFVENGTTYIPMRRFLSFLGWEVSWDGAQKCALAQKGSRTVCADPAAQTLTVDGQTLAVKIPSREEHLYLPLRTLAAFLDYSVSWDGGSGVALTSGGALTQPDAEELSWLARIISAEAGGESLAGQVAVGNVVLNRVASEEFPDTVYDVIFDREDGVQFEPVSNGTVYNEPGEDACTAAKLAFQGVNTAGKSLYFFNPSLSQGTWIVAHRTYYTTIGCHQFYL